MSGRELEVAILELGSAGDGVAQVLDGRIFVPSALPGERWRVRLERKIPEGWNAMPLECLVEMPRATPCCPHFGRCGGCRLQHLPDALYQAQRSSRIATALRRRGLPADAMGEVRTAPLASRRRLRLGLARGTGGLTLGLRQRASHRLEPIGICPVARPVLAALLPRLAGALGEALGRPEPGEVSLTLTEAGIDLLLHARRPSRAVERERLAAMADRLDLGRVGWDAGEPDPVVTRRQPYVRLGGVPVEVPLGAFLQATEFGEGELGSAVTQWTGGAARVLDLYAGLGTLTLGLAHQLSRLHAVEGNAASATALRRAAAAARLAAVEVSCRDLTRRPLTGAELAGWDVVVLDPPRAGAVEQVRELANAAVRCIVYASCSPESFARDARLLVDSGFELQELRPIDQFRYAAEVELIARFVRRGTRERP
ncbi:MAG: class I SAM-dependent RNA methyltransferase [Geminicoccaceae bacterium]